MGMALGMNRGHFMPKEEIVQDLTDVSAQVVTLCRAEDQI
jgi:hypothetical protein